VKNWGKNGIKVRFRQEDEPKSSIQRMNTSMEKIQGLKRPKLSFVCESVKRT